MRFSARNLAPLAYAEGFTLWHYFAQGELLSEFSSDEFFSAVKGKVNTGDIVMVSARDGAQILTMARSDAGPCIRSVA